MTSKVSTARRTAPLHTPTGLRSEGARDIAAARNAQLADFFALYLKTNLYPDPRSIKVAVATLLTIFFVPALYAAWFRVERAPAPNLMQSAATVPA
jgi:hypothetical protein